MACKLTLSNVSYEMLTRAQGKPRSVELASGDEEVGRQRPE